MSRLYKIGLVIGRFQMLHKGHEFMIRRALDLCHTVVVYIGSSQEQGTKINPFSFERRKQMLCKVFKEEVRLHRIYILPLPDVGLGNSINWGKYVLDKFYNDFMHYPDLYVTGCEKERSSWFTNDIAPNMDELRLTRHNIEVSATECREALLSDDFDTWANLVPKELYNLYAELKQELEKVQ